MSERGTFAMDRGWFDHPSFADEPYTERESWAWLIAEAAYRPHCRRVGSFKVTLAAARSRTRCALWPRNGGGPNRVCDASYSA
jgi:hypothetical protein